MELKILYHGYALSNTDGRVVKGTFQTKKDAVTYFTGYDTGRPERVRVWNIAKREGWRIKSIIVVLN